MRADIPFSPSKSPIFYGWIVLFWSAIGVILSLPGQTMGVGVFTDDLMSAASLSRLELSTAYLIGTVTSALFLPRAGRLYDQYGARAMTPVVSICLALMMCCLPFVDSVTAWSQQLLPDWLHTPAPFMFITVCFIGLRFFGQGTLTMVSKNMVLKWFVRRKGFANGVLGIAVSFGFSLGVVGMNMMLTAIGWQNTLYTLALIVGPAFAICAYLFYRDSPAESGLFPDGMPPSSTDTVLAADGRDHTLQETKSTFIFWWFVFGLSLVALLHTAISFHLISLFELADIHRDDAVQLFLHMAVISAITTVATGWLSDHIPLKYLLATMGVAMCLTCLMLGILQPGPSRYLLALGMGIGQGCFGILSSVTWPHFFGLAHLGAITGVAMSFIVFGSALGPAMYGLSEHLSGDYLYAHITCLILSVLLVLGVPRLASQTY